jgi:hypothetical protein
MSTALPLHPLTLAQLLDRAFRLYRNNFGLFVGIVAAAFIPITVLQVMSQALWGTTTIVNLVQNIFIESLVSGSLAWAISRVYHHQPTSNGSAYQACLRRYLSLLGAIFLQGLSIGVPGVILIGCGSFLILRASRVPTSPFQDFIALIPFFLIIPVLLYFFNRWAVVIPSIIVEDLGATQGLRRSWRLTAGSFWRILGVLVVAFLLTFFVAQLPGLTLRYAVELIAPISAITPVVDTVISQLSHVIALPLSMAITVLLYYDLRARKEGYDLEILAQEVALP